MAMAGRVRREAGESRRVILEAAAEALKEKGIRAFTLDLVAKKCGISKAGIIHHFPTKEALTFALISEAFDELDRRMAELVEEEKPGVPGRWTRAYVKAHFAGLAEAAGCMAHLYELAAAQPQLVQQMYGRIQQYYSNAKNDGIDPVTAMTVMMATDGCMQEVTLGAAPADAEHIQQIYERLLEMTGARKSRKRMA